MKYKFIYFLPCPFKHALGNMISGIISLVASIIMIISLGYLHSDIELWWIMKRDKFGLYESVDGWFKNDPYADHLNS